MKKCIGFLFTVIACILFFPIPARASGFEDNRLSFVTDEAGLLSDEEWSKLEGRAEEISEEYKCGTYIITVDNFRNYTAEESIYGAAKGLYMEYSLGYGEEKDGELLLLSMEDRDYALIAYGYGNTAFTDYGKDKLSEKFLDDLGEDKWYAGVSDYLEKSSSMLRSAREGHPLDRGSNPLIRFAGIVLSLAAGLLAALVIVACVTEKVMKSVAPARSASVYLDQTSIKITGREDYFTHRTETRELVNSDRDSGGTTIDSDGFSGKSGKF